MSEQNEDYWKALRLAMTTVLQDGLTIELNGNRIFLDGYEDNGTEVFFVLKNGARHVEIKPVEKALDLFLGDAS